MGQLRNRARRTVRQLDGQLANRWAGAAQKYVERVFEDSKLEELRRNDRRAAEEPHLSAVSGTVQKCDQRP